MSEQRSLDLEVDLLDELPPPYPGEPDIFEPEPETWPDPPPPTDWLGLQDLAPER